MDYSLLIGVLELNNQLDNLNNFQCKYYFPDIENNKIIYLFGIVDYLQEYNMKKKAAKSIKSLMNDVNEISTIPPNKYSERFLKFINSILE
ncbi:hypothetical protein ABK040_009483 [Willaertia magna]